MNTSTEIGKLAAALAKAQGDFKAIPKNKTGKVSGENKHGQKFNYEYKYAALPDVLDGIKAALSANELAVIQATGIVGGMIVLRTRVVHASGEFIESEYPVCSITGEHQKMGAAMTYARRYALTALVGVAADEDVDGSEAEHVDPQDGGALALKRARVDAEAYVAASKTTLRNYTKVSECDDWWNAEGKNRQFHFKGDRNDPLYIELYNEFQTCREELRGPKPQAAE